MVIRSLPHTLEVPGSIPGQVIIFFCLRTLFCLSFYSREPSRTNSLVKSASGTERIASTYLYCLIYYKPHLEWLTLQNRRTIARLTFLFKIVRNLLAIPDHCLPSPTPVSSTQGRPQGGRGGQLGHFAPGPSLKGAPGGPMKGPLNTCLKDRYTLIEQSDLNTLIEQSQYSS